MRRSLVLPDDAWHHLEQLAAETNSVSRHGIEVGHPSWRVLLARILKSPQLLELINHYLNSPSPFAGKLEQVVIVQPEKPRTKTIAWLYLNGNEIKVRFPEKREDFREVVKSLGCEWSAPFWRRELDSYAGDPIDRVAEMGHYLLAARFCVVFPSVEIREKALTGSYKPEQRRWVLIRTKGEYQNWFALWWRYGENCYEAAMRLSGAHYSKPCIVVPPENFDEVEDFAWRHKFEFSAAALDILAQARRWRESAMVVSVAEIEAAPSFERPDLETPEDIGIDDDLADDLAFV